MVETGIPDETYPEETEGLQTTPLDPSTSEPFSQDAQATTSPEPSSKPSPEPSSETTPASSSEPTPKPSAGPDDEEDDSDDKDGEDKEEKAPSCTGAGARTHVEVKPAPEYFEDDFRSVVEVEEQDGGEPETGAFTRHTQISGSSTRVAIDFPAGSKADREECVSMLPCALRALY